VLDEPKSPDLLGSPTASAGDATSHRGTTLVAIPEEQHAEYLWLKEELVRLTDEVRRLEKENGELRSERGYWRTMHHKAVEREKEKDKKIENLEAQLRYRKHDKHGQKSEKGTVTSEASADTLPAKKRPRGQQPGTKSPGRTPQPQLPVVVEPPNDVAEHQKCCSRCGKARKEFGTEDSEMLEFVVQAHVRHIPRKRWAKTCDCPDEPGIVTAPVPGKLIPKGKLGISIWVEVILFKYLWAVPLNRLLQYWRTAGLRISSGTIIGGMKHLLPLFLPVVNACQEYQMTEGYGHADETTWKVFQEIEGKVGHRWYLWVIRTKCAVVFRMAPGRGANVPMEYFAELLVETILVCDRYSAYKKMARRIGILLAFCWVHVRRDYLDLARDYPKLEAWGKEWAERISQLFHLNHERLKVRDVPLAWVLADSRLREHVQLIEKERDAGLADPQLHPMARKKLVSLQKHWAGLTVFVDRPEVSMDNNPAEQVLRSEVTGRKAYYGSGSVWAAKFAAMAFSILKTLVTCWGINPRRWLTAYLQACADNGGHAPEDLSAFLPWKMSPERLRALQEKTLGDAPAANTS
jgi:transposase